MRSTVLITLLMISVIGTAASFNIRAASGASVVPDALPPYVGRLCLVPGDSTACPQTIPAIRLNSTGVAVVSVNVLGSTTFNAFGIYLHWTPTLPGNGTALDKTNSVLNGNVTANCINGSGVGCNTHDGPGVAHLDVVGTNTTAPTSGRLFKFTLIGAPNTDPHLGFARGCTTVSITIVSSPGSVPNTDLCAVVGLITTTNCATLCTYSLTAVPEEIQSQSLGVHLPTPLASDIPAGNVAGQLSSGGAPNYADTWVMPYIVTLPGNITVWKAQFAGNSTPVGLQIKVLRPTAPNILTVVEAGPPHNPAPTLFHRVPGYPFVRTELTVLPIYTDSLVTVQPGDRIGLTIKALPLLGGYSYPLVNVTGTRYVTHDVPVNGTINLASNTTLTLPGQAPAIEVSIQPSPARLDTSGDGIPDFVALSPEMRALQVDPCRKNVLVQLDYMVPVTGPLTFKPLPDAVNTVKNAFDAAPLPAVSSCPYAGYPKKSGGVNLVVDVRNAIPEQHILSFNGTTPQTFDSIKAQYFDPIRAPYFHYGLFVNHTDTSTRSGIGETFGNNLIVSLGGWHNQVGTVFEQAGTLMHEIGHNLGLRHGGGDDINYKPNYLSVMSYEHQVVGIITKTATGNTTKFDFSREAMPTINETALDEFATLSTNSNYTRWVCPDHHTVKMGLVNSPLDWDCKPDGILTTSVLDDVNNDTVLGLLTGYNDWANLRFKFTQGANYNIGCTINCDIGCTINCDIGCTINCDIGCRVVPSCDFGTELDFPTAQIIEASWATFLANPNRSTSTSVNCVPTSVVVNAPSACTATVSDVNVGAPVGPTGIVSFKSSQPGTFAPTTCVLAGSGGTASCTVNYTPNLVSLGSQAVSAGYTGDASHLASAGSATVNGIVGPVISVSKFFTDANLNPLPVDKFGNPKVDAVLAGGVVRSTNPGEIIAWVNITSNGVLPIQSLRLNDSLPVDWVVAPVWLPAKGAIRVFYANTPNLASNLDITQPSTTSQTLDNPEIVRLAIPSFNATGIGHPLAIGQRILLGVKLQYGLKGTSQSINSYPRNYTDTANAAAWTGVSFAGNEASAAGSASFTATVKLLADINGDGKVDIQDVAIVAYAYGTRPGDVRWNASADLYNSGVVDITDVAIVAFDYGTSV